VMEYLNTVGLLHFEIPRWFSIRLIILIFVVSFLYARRHGPREITGQALEGEATALLQEEADDRDK